MPNPSFPLSELNQVKRIPNRGAYDRETIYPIIDAAPLGLVGIAREGDFPVVVIPMLHARRDDALYFHGAQSSRLLKYLASGQPATVGFALVDGYVLAKSLFHHSMNYRSAVVFGRGTELAGDEQKLEGLKIISDKLLPGRWEDARLPNAQELKATLVVRLEIETASSKIRSGGPKEEPEDVTLPYWSGVLPLHTAMGEPEVDELSRRTPLPSYISSIARSADMPKSPN